MKTLLALILSTVSLCAQGLNVTFLWDPSPTNQQILAYRLVEQIGTNWVFVGQTTTTNYTITNYALTNPRTFSVTASNILMDSQRAVPVTVPSGPNPPTNFKLITTSLSVSLPGVIEFSTDLEDWNQRLRLTQLPDAVGVQIVQYASQPVLFMRPRAITHVTAPPIP